MQPRVNVLLLMLLLCSVAVSAQTYTGVVSVDSIEVQPGASFAVAIRLTNNNVTISALTVPLKFNHASLALDSVSFVGSMVPDNFTAFYHHDATRKTAQISYIPNFETPLPTLTVSSGVVARLFFKLLPSATPGVLSIDSINTDSLFGEMHKVTRVEVVDNSGLATGIYTPEFIPGGVKVLVPTDVDDDKGNLPVAFALGQNYPNPFNPSTTIEFALPSAGRVKLEVFNVLGQLVNAPVDRQMDAGTHQIEFNAEKLPSGIYFYRLSSPFGTETRKMVLLK